MLNEIAGGILQVLKVIVTGFIWFIIFLCAICKVK